MVGKTFSIVEADELIIKLYQNPLLVKYDILAILKKQSTKPQLKALV